MRPPALLIALALTGTLGMALAAPVPALAQSEARFGGSAPIDVVADGSLELHQNEKAIVARTNAVATRGDLRLRADTLTAYYRDLPNGDTEIYRVLAQGDVEITSPNQKAFGAQGIFDVDRDVAVLTGGDLRVVTANDVVTARDSLEYWRADNLAVARGDALAVRGDNRVKADRLVGLLQENAKGQLDLTRIDAEGGVVITTPRDVVQGSKGTYDIGSKLAVLTGDVRITRGRNQLNGSAAEVDLESGVSRLLAAPAGQGAGQGARVRGLFVPEQQGNRPGAVQGQGAQGEGGQRQGERPSQGGTR